MSWIVLTVAAIICRASYGVFSKSLSRHIPAAPVTHSTLLLLICAPIGLLVSPFLDGLSTKGLHQEWMPLLVLVLVSAFGNILYYKGLQRLTAGVTQIAFSSIVIWGALFSVIFLDSRFSIVQLAGAAGLMTAIWLAQYDRAEHFNKAIIHVLASAACFAAFQIMSADVSESITVGTYMLIAYLGPALTTIALRPRHIWKDARQLSSRPIQTVRHTLPASATSVLYYVFAFFAYRHAPDPGIVVVLLTSQVILGLLLAIVFLGERRHVRRTLLAGVVAVGSGMAITG